MNETELDDLLNKWDAPPVPAGLRERINQTPPRKWRFRLPPGLFFGLAAGAAMFLLAVGIAAPQSFASGSIPFTVDFETLDYTDGTPRVSEYMTVFPRDGHEFILTASYPDSEFRTVHMKFFSAMHLLFYPIARQFADVDASARVISELVQNDCAYRGETIIGHESVLGHLATVTRGVAQTERAGYRFTNWRAHDLSCFVLGNKIELLASDGTYRMDTERRSLKITMNH